MQLREAMEKSKLDALVGKIASQAGASRSHHVGQASQATSEAPSTSQVPEEEQITTPPEDFNVGELTPFDQKVYDSEFAHRNFCPIVYVDLDYLKKSCNLDFRPFLEYYNAWLNVHLPYSPSVVRTFYCNMKVHNIKSRAGELIEEGLSTSVRNQHIMLSPSILNDILGFVAPPSDPSNLSANEAFRLLRPNDPIGPLNFKPVDMPIPIRAFHYIYSRTMVNKSKNYTHFAQRDYYLLASFLAGQRRNVGELIFSEMRRFRFSSSRNATIPYPHLVSLILKYNKVWYLEGTEKVHIPRFGRTQLTHMGIEIPVSKTKATSRREGTPSRGDEAQSSAQGPTPPPPPSFLNASLSTHLTEVINQAIGGLKKEIIGVFENLVDRLESQVSRLVDKANANFDTMFQAQAEQSRRINDMEIYLRTHLPTTSTEMPPESTPATASPSVPQTHVLFTDPESNIDVTFERPPSPPHTTTTPQPSSPSFEPEPFDPSTAMVIFTPPSDLTFPQPPSDADKTGEKDM